MNAQLNPDSEDDSELEEDRLSKGGLLLKDMLKQNDDSSDDEDDEEIDEDQTTSAVLLQGTSRSSYLYIRCRFPVTDLLRLHKPCGDSINKYQRLDILVKCLHQG